MSRLHRTLFGFALMLLWASSYADTCIDVNWTPSTKDVNGNPFTTKEYRIYYGTTATALTQLVLIPPTATTYHLCNLVAVKTYVAMTVVNSTNEESARTAVANSAQFFSTIDTNVYKQTQGVNGYTIGIPTTAVGTIKLQSPCDSTHTIDGFSLLPNRDSPDITYKPGYIKQPGLKPQSVYAKCALQ